MITEPSTEMSTEKSTEPTAREVPAGTSVIYADQDGTFEYLGDSSGQFAEIGISLTRTKPHTLRCDPRLVAPADTPIPATDARITVAKQPKGSYPTWKGPWLLTVPTLAGTTRRTFHKTKREGTADGLRAMAVLGWHSQAQTN